MIVGAILTAPVLVAVMATQFFDATWVPDFLLNRWVQLAFIAPGDALHGLADPPHRLAHPQPPHGRHELAHHARARVRRSGTACSSRSPPARFPRELREVYYEAVGVILTLILLGRLLEARAKAGTGEAIRKLIGLQAKTARVVRDGEEREIPIEDVQVGRRHRRPARREDPGRRRGRSTGARRSTSRW